MSTEHPENTAADQTREAVILLADMIDYGRIFGSLPPAEIRTGMLAYHTKMRELFVSGDDLNFEPTEGDGTAAVYGCSSQQQKQSACNDAVKTALNISRAINENTLAPTRVGLSTGRMVETVVNTHTLRFTPAFIAARRLESLCSWFATSFLMDKEVANLQTICPETVVSIGKITPRHYDHPIHIYSIYEPGINNVPEKVERRPLYDFICEKNRGVEFFCGNENQGIAPDFNRARRHLLNADRLFIKLAGSVDIATRRLLEYIDDNPLPGSSFLAHGMRIFESRHTSPDYQLPSLADTLLKSLDKRLFEDLQTIRNRERTYQVFWHKEGETILRKGSRANGIYFIVTGKAAVIADDSTRIGELEAGEVFGEMAYFSPDGRRTATVVAESDMVLRRMSARELENHPESRMILATIARRRREKVSTDND